MTITKEKLKHLHQKIKNSDTELESEVHEDKLTITTPTPRNEAHTVELEQLIIDLTGVVPSPCSSQLENWFIYLD